MTAPRWEFSGKAADQPDRIPDSRIERAPTDGFVSLPHARSYIDTVRERISSFSAREIIDALERQCRAYRQFPELVFDQARGELLEELRLLFEKIAESDGWASLPPVLHLWHCSRELPWPVIKQMVEALRQQGRTDTVLQVISEVLDGETCAKEQVVEDLGQILVHLLGNEYQLAIDGRALVEAARSSRRRLSSPPPGRPPPGRNEPRSREVLLAMAERLATTPSRQRSNSHPALGWPSGRMSFDEFLQQWPCEIELPVDLDQAEFIEEAFRAILLREARVDEQDQYLRLLQGGVVSRSWIIEDLLASEELRSLERRLRVVWGDQVITEPGGSGSEEMSVVTWPWQSPSR